MGPSIYLITSPQEVVSNEEEKEWTEKAGNFTPVDEEAELESKAVRRSRSCGM